MGSNEITAIAEYGVTNEMPKSTFEAIAQEQTKALFASSVN